MRWWGLSRADEEFGGVRSAFKVLDSDGSNELSYREFRGACRNYGFQGDIRGIFEALDQGGELSLQYKEVIFLDDWETALPISLEGAESQMEVNPTAVKADQNICLDYRTCVPGPGAYEMFSGFAATPMMPSARHNGAFTFARRHVLQGLPRTVGPARYEPSLQPTTRGKPSWGFGTATREQKDTHSLKRRTPRPPRTARARSAQDTGRGTAKGEASNCFMSSPGPGSYDTAIESTAPRFSMRPRRVLHLHPAQQAQTDGRPFSH